jgi:hypothetical protein
MFLGHGALLRRDVWEKIGGFPDIVSEDLGFAIHARELGYRGRFLQDVICFESFPDSVRAFRIRHMKWTRGTSEFLKKKMGFLIRAKNISWAEKLDILFPTLNLPLTLLYFMFMLNANIALPYFRPVATCPKFLAQSTALYAALGHAQQHRRGGLPVQRKGTVPRYGRRGCAASAPPPPAASSAGWRRFIDRSHPDSAAVILIEMCIGLGFAYLAAVSFQPSFMGLCLAFLMLPTMRLLGWDNMAMRIGRYVIFLLVVIGLALGSLSLFGMQSTFFGYGFHF